MACGVLIFRRNVVECQKQAAKKHTKEVHMLEECERVTHMQCHDPLAGENDNAVFAEDTRCRLCKPECWDLILGVPQREIIRICIWRPVDGPWTGRFGAF